MTVSTLTLRKNNLRKNKRGQITMFILYGLILVVVVVFVLLIVGIVSNKINTALNQNVTIGEVNLATINAQTFGKFNTMILNHADFIGTSAIFGMILGLFLSAYFTRGILPKWGIILDIFIIISAFIFTIYLSQVYSTLLNALASANETFLEDSLARTSRFMINLPIFVVIIGAIMMFLFHSSIPRRREERAGGFRGI